LAAAIGLVASITVHVLTFFPGPPAVATDNPLFAGLHVGIFAVFGAFLLAFRQRFGEWPRTRRHFLSAFPGWARVLIGLAFAYAAVNFMYLLAEQHGLPQVRDGQLVLIDHGKFIKTLTQDEYDLARNHGTRLFSGHWIVFYLIPTLYFLVVAKEDAPEQSASQSQ
jgi:hypothetical protein